jgi:putative PIN family toxin of toxin-antitoxin system
MIRAVLDVNVLVSALISPRGTPARILDAWREERFIVVVSEPILEEFQRVVAQPRLRRYGLTPARARALMRGLRQFAIMTPARLDVHGVAPHGEDDKLLACAVEGGADYLVTGDSGLLALQEYEGVQIISPADFVRALSRSPR